MTAPVLQAGNAGARLGLTILEAIDKQLGLRLGPQKHPMPVNHVDRAPAEN